MVSFPYRERCRAQACTMPRDNPEAGKNTCSVFGGTCPCKPGASADETQHVDLCRAFLKASGSKYHTPPYLKGVACRSNIWQHTKDVAQSSCAPSALTSRSRSPASVVTNLPDPVSSARIGRENRLRKVKFADDLEQQDDPEEEAPCHDKALRNLALNSALDVMMPISAHIGYTLASATR
jgi:hypothetical protein